MTPADTYPGDKFRGRTQPNGTPVEAPPDVLARVLRLRGVSFEWKDRATYGDSRERQLGVIAQEVERVFPEAVVTADNGLKMVDYAGLVAVLIEAVKELAAHVDELESKIR